MPIDKNKLNKKEQAIYKLGFDEGRADGRRIQELETLKRAMVALGNMGVNTEFFMFEMKLPKRKRNTMRRILANIENSKAKKAAESAEPAPTEPEETEPAPEELTAAEPEL